MNRVLVCGGRNYTDRERLFGVLDRCHAAEGIGQVIHGGAEGADTLAAQWAESRGIPATEFPADWGRHGRAAGPIRNRVMVHNGHPTLVIVFPGGRGTADMSRYALSRGLRVVTVPQVAV